LSPKEEWQHHKNISNNTTMSITIIVHTENKEKLTELFKTIKRHKPKTNFSIKLNAKGYSPWEDNFIKNEIMSFTKYEAFPTNKDVVESVIEMVTKVTTRYILILDENCGVLSLNQWSVNKYDLIYAEKNDLIKLNLDSKYQSIKWFIIDLLSQKNKSKLDVIDDSDDCVRYNKKIENPIFYDKIFYLDGGMGDHIMALPLLERIHKDVHICCKYPVVFDHLEFKGHVHWSEELFGGYRRFVYEQGSTNNSKTIIDAFFELYGHTRDSNDILRYNGLRESNYVPNNGKRIALICSSAAIIQDQESNKNWKEIRWLKLVNELQQRGYYVIQVGTSKDNQIPMVDMKFLDQPLSKLASLVDDCSLWISVDTFFHHFASSIKPNVGICLTPFYNDHAKHPGVTYIEKDCGKDFSARKWWLDLQQPERKECMDLIQLEDVLPHIKVESDRVGVLYNVNKDNIHLLEFSSKNSRSFSELIIVKFDDFSLEDKLRKLKDIGIIDGVSISDNEDILFQDMDFKVILSADEIVEKHHIISVINEMRSDNIDVAESEVIRHFKNLNYTLTNDNKITKPLIFKINGGPNIKLYEYLKLRDLSLTYDNKLDENFSTSFNTFYYDNPNVIIHNNVEYNVNYNEISDLKIQSLIKVICLSNGPKDNCSNWRIFQPYDRFENGINYELLLTPKFNFERDKRADVVIISRPLVNCLNYIQSLRKEGVKIVLDYDDVLPLVNLYETCYLESSFEVLTFLLNDCDLVTTTNDKLKHYFENHSKSPVKVVPNILKPELISKKTNNDSDKIILGWYGSGGHLKALKIINEDVLRILDEFDNVYFNLYSENQDIRNLFKHDKVNFITYNYNFYEFLESINDVDINLSPIEESYINFCKSDIRIQLPSHKGIPSIVSDFSEYKRFAELNDGALLCRDNEWYDKIKSLILDKEKYNNLVTKSYDTLIEYYDYKKHAEINDNNIKNLIIKNG
jgi:ADP-heptose:LPS heptosyltransferase